MERRFLILKRSERSRKKKERERALKHKHHRMILDLPVDMKERLFAIANRGDVPVSHLVVFLLLEPMQFLEEKTLACGVTNGHPAAQNLIGLGPGAKGKKMFLGKLEFQPGEGALRIYQRTP
jgi:hypothetical protein